MPGFHATVVWQGANFYCNTPGLFVPFASSPPLRGITFISCLVAVFASSICLILFERFPLLVYSVWRVY